MPTSVSIIDKDSKYHVPNLARALCILELLTEHPEGLTTTMITSLLKYPRNSMFRITSTLLAHGYILRDEETKVFQLSQKLLTMGFAALGEETLVEKSLVVMRQLRDRFKETVPLGILHGNEGLVVEEVQGLHSFRFVLEPGRRFNLHSAAPGKVLLAYLPEDDREKLISKCSFKKFNKRTITNREALLKCMKRVRSKGYAIDRAEEFEGMHCLAAPIFNRHGYPVAAIWLSGPSYRIKEEDFANIGIEVRKAGDRISKSFGYFSNKNK